jgi:hypothetical protein
MHTAQELDEVVATRFPHVWIEMIEATAGGNIFQACLIAAKELGL